MSAARGSGSRPRRDGGSGPRRGEARGGRSARMSPLGHAAAAASALVGLPLAGALALRPRWRDGLGERLGLAPGLPSDAVWVHAASVGEARAASWLVDRLLDRGRPVRASTSTLTGRRALRSWRPRVPCHLAPLDHPWTAGLALSRATPAALVLVEAELWPSWIAAAQRRDVPVLLVSGRMSDRTFARYRRLPRVAAPTLAGLAAIGARTERDAERFLRLGARPDRVSVTGDLKLDADEKPPEPPIEIDRLLGRAPLVVAGSTHAGEEEAALVALERLEAEGLAPVLALAPRHPERVDEVLRLLRRRGRSWRRRTRLGDAPLGPGEVLVLDTIGDLAGLYVRAALAFVGGTLDAVGGHNVLEPASVGCPVLVGPHTGSVRQAVDLLSQCGAARVLPNGDSLGRAMGEWLRSPTTAARAGEAGRRARAAPRGTAARTASVIESGLAARAP